MIPILGKPINFKDYTRARVMVHRVGWFGTPGHINMNYVSSDIAVCDRQAAKLVEYGAYGVNQNYYGPEGKNALSSLRMLDACARAGLAFSLCIDAQAVTDKGLTGDAATAEYIRIVQFVRDAFFISPAYLRDSAFGGRCVLNFFGDPQNINWASIRASVPVKMALLFQGSSGFTHAESDGGYGWINPTTLFSSINLPAIQAFTAAAASANKLAWYPVYTGFDDSMASWGRQRYMSRRLGQTLLDTLALVPKDAEWAIFPTLDDQEEGSAIEYSQG